MLSRQLINTLIMKNHELCQKNIVPTDMYGFSFPKLSNSQHSTSELDNDFVKPNNIITIDFWVWHYHKVFQMFQINVSQVHPHNSYNSFIHRENRLQRFYTMFTSSVVSLFIHPSLHVLDSVCIHRLILIMTTKREWNGENMINQLQWFSDPKNEA